MHCAPSDVGGLGRVGIRSIPYNYLANLLGMRGKVRSTSDLPRSFDPTMRGGPFLILRLVQGSICRAG